MKLPFETSPYIVTYHNKAFPLGVIQGNSTFDLTPWISGKFINCVFNPTSQDHKFDFATFDSWGEGDGVNSSQTIRLDKPMFKKLSIDILKTIICLMDNGYYIHGSYNEKYIPSKRAYNKYDFIHDYILIGYEKEGVLYSVGYTKSGKYEEFTITFKEYLDSLININTTFIAINTCKYHKDGNFLFNKDNFIRELSDYVSSTFSKNLHTDYLYGLEAINAVKDLILNNCSDIDMRYVKILKEHKNLMQLRIDYLYRFDSIDIPGKYKIINKEAEKIYSLCLKYKMKENKEILKSIEEGFNLILDLEKQLLPLIIKDVENTNI